MRTFVFFATIFVTGAFSLTACSGSGKGGDATQSLEMSGYWVEEDDLASMENLKEKDGSCRPYKVSEKSDLGHFYLEIMKIENDGRVMDLAAVEKDSSDTGDYYHKWTLTGEGKLVLAQTFKQGIASQLLIKEYDHKLTLIEDDTIESHIIKQMAVQNGQELVMENEKSLYFRINTEELKGIIAFAKDCAAKQTLSR